MKILESYRAVYCELKQYLYSWYCRISMMNLVIGIMLCLATQIPYRNVWFNDSTFVYDAFTSFDPIYTALLKNLSEYKSILNVYDDRFPSPIIPSYLFISNIGRQLAALFVSNTPAGHALIQAWHSLAIIPAVALLFRSLAIPFPYGMLGGAIYCLSGIHVSVSQHTGAYEALVYLVLSLFLIRTYILRFSTLSLLRHTVFVCLIIIILTSLVRWYHEPIIYFIPISIWVLAHVRKCWPQLLSVKRKQLIKILIIISILTAICSLPVLLMAFEMSQINKSHIDSYEQAHIYFSEWPLFWLGLIFPNVTGATYIAGPPVFTVGTDPTLAYLFAGSFTVPFSFIHLVNLFKSGRHAQLISIISIGFVLLGYSIGPGSFIYWGICHLFPFLWKIGHPWYGLHLFYILSAFCVVQGVKESIERPDQKVLSITLLVSVVLIFLFVYIAPSFYHYTTFIGPRKRFVEVIHDDALLWLLQVFFVLSVLFIYSSWSIKRSKSSHTISYQGNLIRPFYRYIPMALFFMISIFIVADLIRPVLNAHFVPSKAWINWINSPDGGFKPSIRIKSFLDDAQGKQPSFRPVRVLSFAGWQGNLLYPIGVAQMRSGDSQGNRFLEEALQLGPPTDSRLKWIAEVYGVDFIWINETTSTVWKYAFTNSQIFEKVFSDPSGGDLYSMKKHESVNFLDSGNMRAMLGWYLPPEVVSRVSGQIKTAWRFDVTGINLQQTEKGDKVLLSLPIMWLSLFEAYNEAGRNIPLLKDDNGLLQAKLHLAQDSKFIVQYPSRNFENGLLASFLVYILCVIIVALSVAYLIMLKVQQAMAHKDK